MLAPALPGTSLLRATHGGEERARGATVFAPVGERAAALGKLLQLVVGTWGMGLG